MLTSAIKLKCSILGQLLFKCHTHEMGTELGIAGITFFYLLFLGRPLVDQTSLKTLLNCLKITMFRINSYIHIHKLFGFSAASVFFKSH